MNNWEERFDKEFVHDLGEKCEPVFLDPNGCVGPIKKFIKDIRRKDMEELIKRLPDIKEYNPIEGYVNHTNRVIKLIKDYYNK